MATTRSLFFVFCALAATALTVNSSPVGEINPQDEGADTKATNNLIAGEREPGDYLAGTWAFAESHTSSSGLPPLEIFKEIDVYPGQITQLLATPNGDTKISIAAGGPGEEFAVLKCQSPTNNIQFTVQVYAK